MKRRETIIHIICWVAYSLIVFYWLTNMFDSKAAFIHVIRFISLEIIVFYINLHILLPKFFEHGKYLKYSFYILMVFVFTHFIFHVTLTLMPPPEFKNVINQLHLNGKIKEINPRKWDRLIIFTFVNVIPTLFFSTILWISESNRKRKQREVSLVSETLHSEMRFLKSQINPHFLFNALNNIYSLSFTKSEKAPQMIMKLSEMLRHVVYDSGNTVRLEKEITYIHHFIAFQKLKTEEEINVIFDHKNVDPSFSIEPMLLIPFVENAFKHSDIENNEEGFIRIFLGTCRSKLDFEVENTTPRSHHTKDRISGIGIENVTKRLELSYPGRSQFKKTITENRFKIQLTLEKK